MNADLKNVNYQLHVLIEKDSNETNLAPAIQFHIMNFHFLSKNWNNQIEKFIRISHTEWTSNNSVYSDQNLVSQGLIETSRI